MSPRKVARRIAAELTLYGRFGLEQCQRARHFGFGLASRLGDLPLRVAQFIAQAGERIGEVVRMEVGTLPVFNDLPQQNLVVLGRLHPARHLGEAGCLGRLEAALTGNDLVDVLTGDVANADWLEYAELPNGRREFDLGVIVQRAPRLGGVSADAADGDEESADETAPTGVVAGGRQLMSERERGARGQRSLRGLQGGLGCPFACGGRLRGIAAGRRQRRCCGDYGW